MQKLQNFSKNKSTELFVYYFRRVPGLPLGRVVHFRGGSKDPNIIATARLTKAILAYQCINRKLVLYFWIFTTSDTTSVLRYNCQFLCLKKEITFIFWNNLQRGPPLYLQPKMTTLDVIWWKRNDRRTEQVGYREIFGP